MARYVRWIALGLSVLFVCFVAVYIYGFAHGDPQVYDRTDAAAAASLLQLARQTLAGNASATAAAVPALGAIVAAYDNQGKKWSAGCFAADAAQAVSCAADKLAAKNGIDPQRLSLHLLHDLRGVKSAWLRDHGVFYQTGLYAVLLADEKQTRALSEIDMHIRGYSLKTALAGLAQDKGIAMQGKPPKTGALLAAAESFTDDANGNLVRLYRASSIMPPPTSTEVVEACKLGGDYLCRTLKDDDTWLYEGNIGRDKFDKTYNQLRHAGTCYALYQLTRATGELHYRETADKAWRWLEKQVRRDKDAAGNVCAFPVEKGKAKLGGAGLMLIALAERMKLEANEADRKLGRELAAHIMRCQEDDGSFQSYYQYNKKKKASRRRSIYYPGEAMLGLMRLNDVDPNPKYVDTVAKAASYLIHERWRIIGLELNVPPDAWLMLALNELHKARPQKDFADYCMKLVDGMINDQLLADWQVLYPDYRGGFFPFPPMITPSGSRSEGLTASYMLGVRAGYDVTALKRTIVESTRWQIERMIRPEFAHLYPNPQRALGAFRHSPTSNRVRIDSNQHNISGLLVAAEILKK